MTIINAQDLPPEWVDAEIKDIEASHRRKIKTIEFIVLNDGTCKEIYDFEPAPDFERIRRITGYLVGTVDRWNDGKKAELRDRVKHI